MANAYHMTLKIILLGDYSVNKGTLLKALASVPNQPGLACLGSCSGFVEMLFLRNKKRILVKVYDTAGQERFRSITSSYYRGAHGCILMFDVAQRTSFESLTEWHKELLTNSMTDDMAVILVGSKPHQTPSGRQVTPRTAQEFANYLGVPYEELGVQNVQQVLHLVGQMVDRIMSSRETRGSVLTLSSDSLTPKVLEEEEQRQQQQQRGREVVQRATCAC